MQQQLISLGVISQKGPLSTEKEKELILWECMVIASDFGMFFE